jgi:SAM-dependent methyltransferase
MKSFDANWLALREPADRRARADTLARMLRRAVAARDVVTIADLGCGTGSNARHLAPQLGGRQTWHLIDSDADMLAAAPGAFARWADECDYTVHQSAGDFIVDGGAFQARIIRHRADLNKTPQPVENADIVTASALLDLVSHDWLERLVAALGASGAAALFALSYDGRIGWSPGDGLDATVRNLVNQHQRGTKSFGRALGPDGAETAAALLHEAGYEVETAASDWRLSAAEAELQQYLHAGWATAASAMTPTRSPDIHAWLGSRMDLLAAGTSNVTVGHTDILALPPD